jgi:hypothetical protein
MAQLDKNKLHQFVGKMLGDLGGAFSVPTVRIGLRLGLFNALHEGGPPLFDLPSAYPNSTACSANFASPFTFAQVSRRLKLELTRGNIQILSQMLPGNSCCTSMVER